MNELPEDLERALRNLDALAARRAEGVDAGRVAARVTARLRAEPVRGARFATRTWALPLSQRWVGLAAAALVVVLAGTVARGILWPSGGAIVPVPVIAQGIDSLDVQGLERLLRVAGEVRPSTAEPVRTSVSGTWDDLSEAQLRAVLQAVQQSKETEL
jgi:hypothetical protein